MICVKRRVQILLYEPRRMLKIIQRFGKHYSCHI